MPILLIIECNNGSLVDRGQTFQPIEPRHVSSSRTHSCALLIQSSLFEKNNLKSYHEKTNADSVDHRMRQWAARGSLPNDSTDQARIHFIKWSILLCTSDLNDTCPEK